MSKQDKGPDMARTSYIRLQQAIGPHGQMIDKIISVKPGANKAKCVQCGSITQSDTKLPLFLNRKYQDFDEFYCGCYGWE